jgi:DNA-binding transcriptional LysR family regulator
MNIYLSMVTFIAVVDTNDVRNASRILKMDLPAVIDALHELECHFGIKLISVYGRYIKLTDAGQKYSEAFRRILFDVDNTERRMRKLYTPSGRLRKIHKQN